MNFKKSHIDEFFIFLFTAHGGQPGSSQLPVRSQQQQQHPNSVAPTLTVPNGPSHGPISQSSPNPNRRPPETTGYFHSNFPKY